MKSVPVKRKIVHSWTKPVCFAIAGGARKNDGLYKSLNYQLYIDKEKRKPPPPFSCERKIATNRSIEKERGILFLALELQDRLCAYLRYCFCTYKYIQTTYTIKGRKEKRERFKKKDMKR